MVRVRYSFGSRHTGRILNIKKQRGKYPDIMKKVIDISDIILEILDSRFINETRNLEIEELIKKKGKKIVYVLNKIDLVDVKKIKGKIPKDIVPRVFVSVKNGRGARELRERIRIEASRVNLGEKFDEKEGIRKKVHIGIIGYPNTGKSSLINLITRRGVAKTSKQAGYTRGMQKIRLTDKILILDTPGVIPEANYSSSKKENFSEDAKVGARTYSDVKNPEDVVHYLMSDNSKFIEKFYDINAGGNSEVLIDELGKVRNFLRKGGKVDVDRTARLILRDWQEGKIKV